MSRWVDKERQRADAEQRERKAKEATDAKVRRAWEEHHSIYEVRMALGCKEGVVIGALQRLGLYTPKPKPVSGAGRRVRR